MIIRFGATFPEITLGSGRSKVTGKDFNNLVYELNACDSFNMNLIKGVAKEHFEPLSKKRGKGKAAIRAFKDIGCFPVQKTRRRYENI